MKQIVLPDYFRSNGKSLWHSEMGDFYGKKENFKLWHWLVRNYDKRVPDYIVYAEQYRFKNKEDFNTCTIDIEASRCELGKIFATEEFVKALNEKLRTIKKRNIDSLNGILKHITLTVKIDVTKDIVELDRLTINQYTIAGSETNNDPKKQWIYRKRMVKAGDLSYRFSPYIDDTKYWTPKSKNDMYLGTASFGVSESRSIATYKSLNQYISYVVGEVREWLGSLKGTEILKEEIKYS